MTANSSRRKRRGRRLYDDELKGEAVQMLLDGHSAEAVAKNLGVSSVSLLYRGKANLLRQNGAAAATLAWTQSIAGAEKTFQTGGAGAVKDYVLAVSSDEAVLANDLAEYQMDFDQADAVVQVSLEAAVTAADNNLSAALAAALADYAVCHGLQWNAPPNRTRQPPLQAVLIERYVAMGRCPST